MSTNLTRCVLQRGEGVAGEIQVTQDLPRESIQSGEQVVIGVEVPCDRSKPHALQISQTLTAAIEITLHAHQPSRGIVAQIAAGAGGEPINLLSA